MDQLRRIAFISATCLLPLGIASAQPISCSTPVGIGTINDKNPRILYNDQTGQRVIVTERLSGPRFNKALILTDPGADNIFGTPDDSSKNLTWPHPSQSDEAGVSINQGSLVSARSTKNLVYPGVATQAKVVSLRLSGAGPDMRFRTSDDKKEREIKAIRYNAPTTVNLVKTGIGDGLVGWVYGKKTGGTVRIYVGGCDLQVSNGSPGSCSRRTAYEKRIPTTLLAQTPATAITSPVLPVRLQIGAQSVPVVIVSLGTPSNQQTLIFRMDQEEVYNAGLGNRTPMTWMSNNRLFTSRPNGNGVIYEAATPDGAWNFETPLWSYLTEVPPNGGMRALAISDTEDEVSHSQAYIGSYTRVVHHTFSSDRYYKRYYFVRPFGVGSAFFLELNDEVKQPDTFAVGGDTVAFHRYNPGNAAYLGIGVMTCR